MASGPPAATAYPAIALLLTDGAPPSASEQCRRKFRVSPTATLQTPLKQDPPSMLEVADFGLNLALLILQSREQRRVLPLLDDEFGEHTSACASWRA